MTQGGVGVDIGSGLAVELGPSWLRVDGSAGAVIVVA